MLTVHCVPDQSVRKPHGPGSHLCSCSDYPDSDHHDILGANGKEGEQEQETEAGAWSPALLLVGSDLDPDLTRRITGRMG